jgi:hypothetical protein
VSTMLRAGRPPSITAVSVAPPCTAVRTTAAARAARDGCCGSTPHPDQHRIRVTTADRLERGGPFGQAAAKRRGELVADVKQAHLVLIGEITEGHRDPALMLSHGTVNLSSPRAIFAGFASAIHQVACDL